MKKAYWIIGCIALVFGGDRIGGWLLDNVVRESQFRYSRLYRGDAACDLMFVGNSRGLIFYQPYIEEKTGRPTFNLSYNAMPINLANALVKDYLDQHKAPKVLVLDVTMLDDRMDPKLVTGFNGYVPYSERLSSLMRDSFPNDYYGGHVSHLYRYNSEVFQRAFYYLAKSDEDWLLDRVISPSLQRDVENFGEFKFTYSQDMLKSLADLTQYAQIRNVRVELVVNPYFPPFVSKISNLAALKADIEKATGLPVHDYSTAVAGMVGFGDYQHLNKNGAKEYLDKLMKDGILEMKTGLSLLSE
jgi:hypothetical protein